MLPNLKLVEVKEGLASIVVPDLRFYSRREKSVEPAWAPVFYNPLMRVSRDISVAIVAAYARLLNRKEIQVCEPLSATGVRGIRYAVEVDGIEKVIINDKNKLAYGIELMNIQINKLNDRVVAFNREARALLHDFAERGEKFDIIDLDPFGSPAPFVESALLTLKHGGLLMVTATDLAPLFGVSPSSCKRKYFAVPLRSEFAKEIGARILAAFVIREAAKLGLAASPIFTFLAHHSLRIAFLVRRSRSSAKRTIERVGMAMHCPKCTHRFLTICSMRELLCPNCGSPMSISGPLWIGELWNPEFSVKVLENYKERGYLGREGLRILELIALESSKPPLYTTTTIVAKIAKLPEEPSIARIEEAVRKLGAEFSPTHFDHKGFRSSAQPYVIATLFER